MVRFGAAVKGFRQRLAVSQEELAERAGLHRTYVSDIERGARNLSLSSIDKLAQALEVSTADLLGPAADVRSPGFSPDMVEILMAEDNRNDAELTLRAFKRARISNPVHLVRDGAEALDFIFCAGRYARRRAGSPLLMLLDLGLPKIDGLEVLRRIRGDERTRDLPVIVLTISDDDRKINECRRLGANAYLVKPVEFQNLSSAATQLSLHWGLLQPPPQLRV